MHEYESGKFSFLFSIQNYAIAFIMPSYYRTLKKIFVKITYFVSLKNFLHGVSTWEFHFQFRQKDGRGVKPQVINYASESKVLSYHRIQTGIL